MTQTKKLTSRQTRAIDALISEPTIEQAAERAGVTRKTIYRWLQYPGFRAELTAAESAAIDKSCRRLIAMADKAITALDDVLDNPSQNGAGNKRLAAAAIIDIFMRLRELRNIENRLSELESVVFKNEKRR
jgi:hypothetical protein